MKKILAFTLAETLIVMGIIGIVAALTLPNLNGSTGDKEKVTKVKKIYQNLTDAYGRATAVYGPFDEWFANDSNNTAYAQRVATRLTEFMKVSKDCGFDTSGKCFTTKDRKFNTSTYSPNNFRQYNLNSTYKVILSDGTALSINCSSNILVNGCEPYFDIDGPNKGASAWGIDLFMLFLSGKQGLYAYADVDSAPPCGIGFDCVWWIMNKDNVDYLKTSDGKTCPNGTVLTRGGNSSCK